MPGKPLILRDLNVFLHHLGWKISISHNDTPVTMFCGFFPNENAERIAGKYLFGFSQRTFPNYFSLSIMIKIN